MRAVRGGVDAKKIISVSRLSLAVQAEWRGLLYTLVRPALAEFHRSCYIYYRHIYIYVYTNTLAG